MTSRYDDRKVAVNDEKIYSEEMKNRGVRYIRQYVTGKLRHPSSDEISQMNIIGHTWSLGDRYYKLAHEYYGRSDLWWVVAWYNQIPIEGDISAGDTIYIPLPLEKILKYLDV